MGNPGISHISHVIRKYILIYRGQEAVNKHFGIAMITALF